MALLGMHLAAAQSVTYLKDGRTFTGTLLDMSSRTGMVEYFGNTKIHRSNIWMINYADANWNYPDERQQLSDKADTVFLRNGKRMHVRIVDFSSRRKIYEFQGGGSVHESQVKRIYFCCSQLPDAYRKLIGVPDPQNPQPGGANRYASVFLFNGKSIVTPLSYLNNQKTGFTDGLQINTHDIWMINLTDKNWNFVNERRQLDRQRDTIFLKNGGVVHDNVVDFSEKNLTFRFERSQPIHESQIKRIYFCCEPLPQAYRGLVRRLR
jgi:sRNA-binding regulator protein Hfq